MYFFLLLWGIRKPNLRIVKKRAVGGRLRKGTTGVKVRENLDRLRQGENINGTEDQVCNRGTWNRVNIWHSPDEKRQSKTERRLPHHLYISLKPINFEIESMGVERETWLWKSKWRLFKLGERSEEENEETLLSFCDICPLNGINSTERSNQTLMQSQRKRERQGEKHKWESRGKKE